VTLFGASLAGGASASASAPFPATLAGVQVQINGSPAPLVSVSDAQVNFLAPANLMPGAASLVVQTPRGTSDPAQVQVDAYAPGIFFDALTGYGAILNAGTAHTTQVEPAKPGGYIEIYCTGLGSLSVQPSVQIAGLDASVVYSGVTSIPGLYQVNVQIPNAAPSGAQPLTLTITGIMSNTVKILLASGP
jgi:uncharacterized protein (TIGR03437 family)